MNLEERIFNGCSQDLDSQINDKQEGWIMLHRPGYFGKKRDRIQNGYNTAYGQGNWRIQWQWGNQTIPFETAIQLYEDAYYEFLKQNKEVVDWLITTARDVYDNDESNVHSGLDYSIQENYSSHYQDISIRRVVLRLGKQFQGEKLVQVRSPTSEGCLLSPGVVPFHIPEKIAEPRISGWWKENTIEDFWQSNKVTEIRKPREI